MKSNPDLSQVHEEQEVTEEMGPSEDTGATLTRNAKRFMALDPRTQLSELAKIQLNQQTPTGLGFTSKEVADKYMKQLRKQLESEEDYNARMQPALENAKKVEAELVKSLLGGK